MSRKLVLVSVFLALLPAMLVSAKGPDDDPFGSDAPKPAEAKPLKPKVVVAKPNPSPGPKLQGGEKAILKAFQEETAIEFVDTPLADVLDYLSHKHRIPIIIDRPALKEAGVEESTPITFHLTGIPLRSALEMVLDELGLKWTIHHDVLLITSPTKAEGDDFMLTRSYDVTDLVTLARDHEEQDPLSPTRETQAENGYYSGPMFNTGMGDRGYVPAGAYIRPNAQPIIDMIINTIATKTWVDNGGTGTIANLDRLLVISQTLEVHMQIEHFLADLRSWRQARPTLSIELHWLWLDAKQCDRLLAGRAKPSEAERSLALDPERLRQIAREVPGFIGHVACQDGLGTVITAGDRRAIIQTAIPVVGGDGVGYQPVIRLPNVGVVAQVRPTFVPGTKTATLDIASIITRWDPSRKAAIIGAAWPPENHVVAWNPSPAPAAAPNAANSAPATPLQPVTPRMRTQNSQGGTSFCPVDQPVMPTQQIGTTLSVPLGKPVIVGAMTFAAAEDAGLGAASADPIQVYLIATTSIVREAK